MKKTMKRRAVGCVLAVAALATSGCGSLLAESASAGAGIASGALANAVTDNAGVATGIGIGVQAAVRSGVQYYQRKVHGEAQAQIAQVAGPLKVGQVKPWKTTLSLPLESEESGRVVVSRVISSGELDCKEIVVSGGFPPLLPVDLPNWLFTSFVGPGHMFPCRSCGLSELPC